MWSKKPSQSDLQTVCGGFFAKYQTLRKLQVSQWFLPLLYHRNLEIYEQKNFAHKFTKPINFYHLKRWLKYKNLGGKKQWKEQKK